MSQFLISCGGTGGHLAPGIALAEALLARGHDCELIISKKDVDSRLMQAYPHLPRSKSPGAGFSWKPLGFLRFNWQQFLALVFAFRKVRSFSPDLVIGFGGFLTISVAFAGILARCPIVLHEANRRPGRAIRLLQPFARRLYLPPGVELPGVSPLALCHCGYPVRQGITKIGRADARKRLGLEIEGRLLLVFGGSQGASVLNQWVMENFERLASEHINVFCVTGLRKQAPGELKYQLEDGTVMRATFQPFVDHMGALLSAADMVVARAGAGSIAEFITCRLPSILIPYPHAMDDHQNANAAYLEQQGAALVVPQTELDSLTDEVVDLMFNDWLLNAFVTSLERLDRIRSTAIMVEDIERIAEDQKKGITRTAPPQRALTVR